MKSLRKSLNAGRDRPQISTPVPIPTYNAKPPSAILPPQKVIRAMETHKPQAPQELPFQKGDFFYVLKDTENSPWYEAHNPVTGSRGLVPRNKFEEFSKNNAPTRYSQISTTPAGGGYKQAPSPVATVPMATPQTASTPKYPVYYAIVMHDFTAERTDELDARRGDPITVVAQSNREWFVAKPIGKLGRPGLIPVAFVEIHDPATGQTITDINALLDRGDLPKVEDWKRAMLSYKQNSISLGVIDPPPTRNAAPPIPTPSQSVPEEDPARAPTPECLPEGTLLSADVVSFHYEMEEYWFRVDAVYQPYPPPGQTQLPPAKQLILFRVYEDFYEFQVTLLHTFPREAGQVSGYPRILPYMPGPAKDVDDTLTATRREELDEYIHGLCALKSDPDGRHILEHTVLRQFLALKPGDVEHEIDRKAEDLDFENGDYPSQADYSSQDYIPNVTEQVERMNLQDSRHSDGSDYEDEGYGTSPQNRHYDKHPYGQAAVGNSKQQSREENLRIQVHNQNHQRSGSSTSFHTQSYASHSRSHSKERASPTPRDYSNGQSRWNDNGSQQQTPSADSFRSSQSLRSQSQSTAANNSLTNPPISAGNPQTAFVKIKIFDRVADDLIAIRVHPKVSHYELMEKVQARLGSEVRVLKYRDSLTNTFVGLDTDEELRAWMEGTDKHVLYAD